MYISLDAVILSEKKFTDTESANIPVLVLIKILNKESVIYLDKK